MPSRVIRRESARRSREAGVIAGEVNNGPVGAIAEGAVGEATRCAAGGFGARLDRGLT